MKTIKETLELALEALEKLNNTNSHWWQEVDENVIVQLSNAESALREALASVPDWASEAIEQPAQQEPLTDAQIEQIFKENAGYSGNDFISFARAVEAANGIKE